MRIKAYVKNREKNEEVVGRILGKIKEYCMKFRIEASELHVYCCENSKEMEECEKRIIGYYDIAISNVNFTRPIKYVQNLGKEENKAPILLINLDYVKNGWSENLDYILSSELAILKKKELGWYRIEANTLKKFWNSLNLNLEELPLLFRICGDINSHFIDEIRCWYGLPNLVLLERRYQLRMLPKYQQMFTQKIERIIMNLRKSFYYKGISEIQEIYQALFHIAFLTTLPRNFVENRRKYEEDLIEMAKEFLDEISLLVRRENYEKSRNVFRRIITPPQEENLSKTYDELWKMYLRDLYTLKESVNYI